MLIRIETKARKTKVIESVFVAPLPLFFASLPARSVQAGVKCIDIWLLSEQLYRGSFHTSFTSLASALKSIHFPSPFPVMPPDGAHINWQSAPYKVLN